MKFTSKNLSMVCGLALLTSCGPTTKFANSNRIPAAIVAPEKAFGDAAPNYSTKTDPERMQADLLAPQFLQDRYLTKNANGLVIAWKEPDKKSLISGYTFAVLDGAGFVLFKADYGLADLSEGDQHESIISADLADGIYRLSISSWSEEGLDSRSNFADLMVDSTPPRVSVYMGLDPAVDYCTTTPNPFTDVSQRLVSFGKCVQDVGIAQSGVERFCSITRQEKVSPPLPAANDPCWRSLGDSNAYMTLLRIGMNYVYGFAMDAAGNIGSSSEPGQIALNPQLPPSVNIISPTIATMQRAWVPGEKISLRWGAEDDDTPFENIKIILTLYNKDDISDFSVLGCNFRNNTLWKQCPTPAAEASTEIRNLSVAADGKSGQTEYHFTVPTGWTNSKPYVIAITAIDKSGNASVISTQELQVKYEVLAGRTHKGLGGSGGTFQQTKDLSATKAFDKFGQVYLIGQRVKFDAFDNRGCRFVKPVAEASIPQPFDCSDIIVSDARFTINRWTYNPDLNVFYTVGGSSSAQYIYQINFKEADPTKRVSVVLGSGVHTLSRDLAGNASTLATDFKTTAIKEALFYDAPSGRLIFNKSGEFFSIDTATDPARKNSAGRIRYLFGAGQSVLPADQINVSQKDLLLPDACGNCSFAISDDRRMVINGGPQVGWSPGSGYGTQYIVDSVDLDSPDHRVSLRRLMPLTGTETIPALGRAYPERSSIPYITWDVMKQQFIASAAWWGVVVMTLPAKGSPESAYRWQYLLRMVANSGEEAVAPVMDVLAEQTTQANPSPLIARDFWINDLYVASTDLYYLSNNYSGTILTYDRRSNSITRSIGTKMEAQTETLGVNRMLDNPRQVFRRKDGAVFFADMYGLHRLSAPNGTLPEMTTVVADLGPGIVQYYDLGANGEYMLAKEVVSAGQSKLRGFKWAGNSLTEANTINVNNFADHYNLGYGLANSLDSGILLNLTSVYNGTLAKPDVDQTFWRSYRLSGLKGWIDSGSPVTQASLSYTALTDGKYYNRYYSCATSGHEINGCPVPPPVVDGSAKYHVASTFIHETKDIALLINFRSRTGSFVFNSDDSAAFGCLADPETKAIRFVKLKFGATSAATRIYFFDVKTPANEPVPCYQAGVTNDPVTRIKRTLSTAGSTQFNFFNGSIYFTGAPDGVFKLNEALVEQNNTAVGTPVTLEGPMLTAPYGGLEVTGSHIIYTSVNSHRVLRNRCNNGVCN